MTDISRLIRKDLREFEPYQSAREVMHYEPDKIWLNANELPWNITDDIKVGETLNRYPEQQPQQLIEPLARYCGVKKGQMLLSRGSDEAIDLLMRLFCFPNQNSIMICPPTFGMYTTSARLQGIHAKLIPLIKELGFQLDLASIARQWDASVKLIFICSPNSPTGNQIDSGDIINLCRTYAGKSLIIVDEAYIEFAQGQSLVKYLNQYDNLVVLRTMSKAFGLAGARCGLTLANEVIIEHLRHILAPYPLASPTIAAVKAAFTSVNLEKINNYVRKIMHERAKLYSALQAMPIVKQVWPSEANFLLVEFVELAKIMAECHQQGIILRDFSAVALLENCARITVGTPQENERLLKLFTQISNR